MMRKSAVAHLKQQGEVLTSAPKAMLPYKAAPKRKGASKDNCPAKKVTGQSVGANQEDQLQIPTSPSWGQQGPHVSLGSHHLWPYPKIGEP